VVVTGASRGLGLAIARRLCRTGYGVVGVARRETDELASAIEEARDGPGSLRFVPCDLAEIANIPDLARRLRQEAGPVWGLVNNAAIGTEGALALMHNTQIEELVRLNVVSPLVLTKYVLRGMLAERQGRIVNVSSIIGFTGYTGLAVYGATKAAMIGFTRSLAREVGPRGITVNAVAPGFMETELTKSLGDEDRRRVAGRSALRRLPEVDDAANAVEFLLGDGARNITGTVMTVDAGSTA
jgi:3-oxoacyl-[acyl-carrier protein] reductase